MEEKDFRRWVMPMQRLMYGLALRLGLCPEDAADAVQETLLRLWRNRLGLPDQQEALRAYCLTALRNECVSKKRRIFPMTSADELAEISDNLSSEDAEQSDSVRHIRRLIETLPSSQQRVIILSSIYHLDTAEIAEATGLSPGNVRQLLSRGRKRLRDLLNRID